LNEHFKKLLEAASPNHAYPIKHKLKDCTMMKNFMTSGALSKGKKPERDPGRKGLPPFPEEEALMSIYDRPILTSPGVSSSSRQAERYL
jgi:hypothetical protein